MSIDRSGAPFIGFAALVALALAFAGQKLLALSVFRPCALLRLLLPGSGSSVAGGP
jgi:hypothetical protein